MLPNCATFKDNCLEYRLDKRQTKYNPDNVDDIKILIAPSGAGKTRTLLELLYSNFGYYFSVTSSYSDFGSGDLLQCQIYCDQHTLKSCQAIELLYFVRVSVCNYLLQKGFNKPSDILLAQLHPIAFFGIDLFEKLYISLLNEIDFISTQLVAPFSLLAIDEIQIFIQTSSVHRILSPNLRPFLTPLIYYSKKTTHFPTLLLSGTGFNFGLIKEILGSLCMKPEVNLSFEIVSSFHPLTVLEIKKYASQFLQDHQVEQADQIVSKILSFELCHGRARFLAYILDKFLQSRDIDYSFSQFVLGISMIEGEIYPLRFLKEGLDANRQLMIGNQHFLTLIQTALLGLIMNGKMTIDVTEADAATAIQYGLGFGIFTKNACYQIEVQELAIVECLRYLIPFAEVVQQFLLRIKQSPNPQMVGYLLEYLVAYALVANCAGKDAAQTIRGSEKPIAAYLNSDCSNEVFFPDHMCGPDIIYKCSNTYTVYIVQVKFVKYISKQEIARAYDTTNPELFYCKRNTSQILKGFEGNRQTLIDGLAKLEKWGYSLKRMLFIHSECSPELQNDPKLITQTSDPHFFDVLGEGIWDCLDEIRKKLNK